MQISKTNCGIIAAFCGKEDALEKKKNDKNNKKGFYFWLEPDVYSQIEPHLYAADVKTRSEFVNEAVRRYIGELDSKTSEEYVSRQIASVVRGAIGDTENHISRILFKLAGEQATLNLIIADRILGDVDDAMLKAYRNEAYDIVRKRQGVLSAKDARDNALSVSEDHEGDDD